MAKEKGITKKDIQSLSDTHLKGIKELLGEQTAVILNAVDKKIQALDLKFSEKFNKIMIALEGIPRIPSRFSTIHR